MNAPCIRSGWHARETWQFIWYRRKKKSEKSQHFWCVCGCLPFRYIPPESYHFIFFFLVVGVLSILATAAPVVNIAATSFLRPPIAVFCVLLFASIDAYFYGENRELSDTAIFFLFFSQPPPSIYSLHFARLEIEQLAIFIYLMAVVSYLVSNSSKVHVFSKMKTSRKKRANTLSIEYICYVLFTYFIFFFFCSKIFVSCFIWLLFVCASTLCTIETQASSSQVSVVNNLVGISILMQNIWFFFGRERPFTSISSVEWTIKCTSTSANGPAHNSRRKRKQFHTSGTMKNKRYIYERNNLMAEEGQTMRRDSGNERTTNKNARSNFAWNSIRNFESSAQFYFYFFSFHIHTYFASTYVCSAAVWRRKVDCTARAYKWKKTRQQ